VRVAAGTAGAGAAGDTGSEAFSARVYVANTAAESVSVFDHDTGDQPDPEGGDPIPVGGLPEGIAITPDRTSRLVTNFGSNSVSLLFGTTIPVERPRGIAITPDGAYVYVTNESSDSVSVIATATNRGWPRSSLPTGSAPGGSPSPRTGPTPT